MGKGDQRTRKGKRTRGTHGKTRPKHGHTQHKGSVGAAKGRSRAGK